MRIPGSNLLKMASRLIRFEVIQWAQWLSNTNGPDGTQTPAYAARVNINASVQPVPNSMYETLGLDLSKNYFLVYVSQKLHDLRRDGAPDLLYFHGKQWNVESNTDWLVDGWRASVVCMVGDAVPVG